MAAAGLVGAFGGVVAEPLTGRALSRGTEAKLAFSSKGGGEGEEP